MRWTTHKHLICACGLLMASIGVRAQLVPSGVDVQVHTTTANDQRHPAVAMDTAGNFIVVWASYVNGQDYDIHAQRYTNTGAPTGAEFIVNTVTVQSQRMPDVTMFADGGFAVVWESYGQDSYGYGVYRRVYDNTGSPITSVGRVNNSQAGDQVLPKVASDQAGNHTYVWMSDSTDGDGFGIYRERYNSTGAALEASVLVNGTTAGYQGHPDIAMDSAGNFIIVWQMDDGDGMGIFGQLYDNTGTIIVPEFLINSTTAGNQQEPAVAMDKDGNFLVTWSSYNQDGDVYGIYAQLYDNAGSTNGGEVLINSTVADWQDNAAVTASRQGNFYVSWTSFNEDGDQAGVYVQGVGSNGALFGVQQQANARTTDFQHLPDLAVYNEEDSLTVVWQDGLRNSASTHDGDDYGVYMTRFAAVDTTSPNAVCQNITIYLDGTGNATIVATDVDGGSTDNVGITNYTVDISSFTCAEVGANNVTLTVEDAAGNTDNCVAVVTVLDTISPTAVCQNVTLYLDGAGNGSITAGDIDGGSSDACGIAALSATPTAFNCFDVGANNVTLTVTDNNGNASNCVATVTVVDTVAPVAACQNITVYLDGAGNASITTGDIDNGSTDNCFAPSLSLSASAFTCADIGANAVTLTATDGSANTSNCVATVTVLDTISPSAVCQNITVYLDGTGNATITAADVDGGSSDNCGAPTLAISASAFTCADVGANSVTLTATDGSGNSDNCSATVTVLDTISPTAVCQNITVYLNGGGSASIVAADIDGGSSDACGIAALSATPTAFNCFDIGANNVTLTVTDNNGNASNCVATVTVLDTVSPVASCQNVTVYLDAGGNATITTGDIDNGSTDNCFTPTLSLSSSSFTCADIGANSVTLTATDGSGNSDNCSATVTVLDTLSPSAVCQNINVYLDGTGNATITAADVDGGSSDNCGSTTLSISASSFTCADIGANSVTLTVTDGSGNSSNCVATVTVLDTISPVVTCQNVTVYLDGTGNASITTTDIDAGSTDNCGAPGLSLDITSFTCAEVGANTVTLTGTDGSGNTGTCTATVTVLDTISPTVSCQNITAYLDGTGNVSITPADVTASSADNCGSPTMSIDISSFTCAELGANTVTLTATDGSGNTANCSATVTVVDTLGPAMACQNITVYLDGTGNATITTGDIDGGSTDNCGSLTLSLSNTAFSCADVGANTVTLIGMDAGGNTDSCTATVTVLDTISPVASCQNITMYLDGTGNATITAADVDGGSSDNCGAPGLTVDISSFTCAELGANTVNLTATDGSGNTGTCAATVTVLDTIAPAMVCQNISVYLDGTGNATINAADVDGGSTDNCGAPTLSVNQTAFACAELGANSVTLIGTDGSGNADSCVATVTVLDTIAPVASCQNITVYLDGAGDANISTGDIDAGSTDNCAALTLSLSDTSFVCTDTGANNVTLTVTDGSGNVDSCSAVVTVMDTLVPSLVGCPGDTTIAANNAGCTGMVSWTAPTGSDNCSFTISSTHNPGDTFPLGTTTVTYTITDASGNTDSCSFDVTVNNDLAVAVDSTNDALCNGSQDGQAFITVSGGTPAFMFDWDNDGTGDNDDMEDALLGAGTWNVVVTDTNGCTAGDSAVIGEPTVVTVVLDSIDQPGCGLSDGAAYITVSGGTPGYVFDWDNDGVGDNDDSEDLTGVMAGAFEVIAIDTNGCMDTLQVNLSNPGGPTLSSISTDVSCNGDTTGTIDLTITSGIPYVIDWDNDGTGDNDDNEDLTGLGAGIYTVIVTDTNNCVGTLSDTIVEPSAIVYSDTLVSPTCDGDSNGVVTLVPGGGTPGYSISWLTGDTTFMVDSLPAGVYAFTITDANGCTLDDSVTISDPMLNAVANVTDISCFGLMDGMITVTPSGGNPGYMINWGMGDSTMTVDSLGAGTYTYTITDTAGCMYLDSATVVEPAALSLSATSTDEMLGSDGTIDLTVTGGTPGYTFDWDNDGTGDNDDTEDLNGLVAGSYQVVVTDTNGCMDSLIVDVGSQVGVITVSPELEVDIYPNPNQGSFTVELHNLQPDAYVLEVTDAIGKLIVSEKVNGAVRHEVNLGRVERGTYFIRILADKRQVTKRIIVN